MHRREGGREGGTIRCTGVKDSRDGPEIQPVFELQEVLHAHIVFISGSF